MSEGHERGVAIIVFSVSNDPLRALLLHRSGFGSGEWAWATPGGALEPGEDPEAAARREVLEETGLELECRPVVSGIASSLDGAEVHVFVAESSASATIRLSREHDRYEWVTVSDLTRCEPPWVREMYVEVLAQMHVC